MKISACILLISLTASLYAQHISTHNTPPDPDWKLIPYYDYGKMGWADIKGNLVIPPKYKIGSYYGGDGIFSNNLAIVPLYDLDTSYKEWYGLINSEDKCITQSSTIFINKVTANISLVNTSDSVFLIRKNGEVISLRKYSSVRYSEWGYGLAMKDTVGVLLDSIGKEIIQLGPPPFNQECYLPNGLLALPAPNDYILNDSITYAEQGWAGIVIKDRRGHSYPLKNYIPDLYLQFSNNPDRVFITQQDDQYGLINQYGQVLVPFGRYTQISDFEDGMAYVIRDDQPYYINDQGKEIVFSCKKNEAEELANAYAYKGGYLKLPVYGKETYWIFFDKKGAASRIKGKYDEIEDFSEHLCKVNYADKFGFINIQGQMVIPFLDRGYNTLGNFSDGLCWFQKDGKYGYIDKTGAEVIPPTLNYPGDFKNGFVFMYDINCDECNVDAYDKHGTQLPFYVKTADTWEYGYRYIYDSANRLGVMDSKGKVVLPTEYNYVIIYNDEIAQVSVMVPNGEDETNLILKSYFVNLKTGMRYISE